MKKGLTTIAILLGHVSVILAQGEIKDAEFIIEKEKKLRLSAKGRIFEPINFNLATRQTDISLEVPSPEIEVPEFQPEITSNYTEVQGKKTYASNHFIRAAFGSLIAPYILYNYQSQSFSPYGATLRHDSYLNGPVRSENSGVSSTDANIWGKLNLGTSSVRGDLLYQRSGFYYYGLSDSLYQSETEGLVTDRIRQNSIGLSVDYEGQSINEKFFYQLKPAWQLTTQSAGEVFNRDNYVNLDASAGWKQNDNTYYLDAAIGFARYSSGFDISRTFFEINPKFMSSRGGLELTAGVKAFSGSVNADTTDQQLFVTPDVYVSYQLASNKIYAEVGGELHQNTLSQLSAENLFLDDSLILLPTYNTFRGKAGLSGFLFSNFYYDLSAEYLNWRDYAFFLSDASDPSRFDVVYETSMQQLSLGGDFNFQPTEGTILEGQLFFHSYGLDENQEAWHLPAFESSVKARQTILKDFSASGTLSFLTGIKSFDPVNQEVINISSILDLSFQLSYSINEQGNVFLAFENVLNRANARFINYPVMPFMASVGFSYRL